MSDFRELCFIKTMRNVIYCLKVCVLTNTQRKFFRLKIVLIITVFKSLCTNKHPKKIFQAKNCSYNNCINKLCDLLIIFLHLAVSHVFQGPGFSGSRIFRVQDFQGSGFSGSRFFRVQVFHGPGL